MISTNNILESRLLDIKPRGYMRYHFQKNTQCSLSEFQFFFPSIIQDIHYLTKFSCISLVFQCI